MDESEDKRTPNMENSNQMHEDCGELDRGQDIYVAFPGIPGPKYREIRKAIRKQKKDDKKKDDKKEGDGAVYEDQTKQQQDSKILKVFESEHFIVQDEKSTESGPSFFCELCVVKIVSLEECQNHIRTKSHRKSKKLRKRAKFWAFGNLPQSRAPVPAKGELFSLSKVPPPSEYHTIALSKLLDSVFAEHGLCPEKDLPLRQEIAEDVRKGVSAKHPECSISLYGSSLTGFGFKDSDVNLDLFIPDEVKVPPVLLSMLELLQKDETFCDVKEEFDAKVPRILFKHVSSGLTCELSPGNVTASNTSYLMKKYGDFDPRVRTLAVGLRQWARVCSIDCQSEGGLPGYSLALMVLQFLQETLPPVLPKWSPNHVVYKESSIAEDDFKRLNKESTGSLWIQLFRFYCVNFKIDQWVISIKNPMPLSRDSKNWGRRRIAIEDPFSLKRNVASSLSSDKVFDYFLGCLKTSFLYFNSLPGVAQIVPPAKELHSKPDKSSTDKNDHSKTKHTAKQQANSGKDDEDIFQMDDLDHVTKQVQSVKLGDDDNNDDDDDDDDDDGSGSGGDEEGDDSNRRGALVDGVQPGGCETTEHSGKEEAGLDELDPSTVTVVYKFDASVLRGRSQPIKTCCYCKLDGHVKSQCPDLKKPTLRKLPQMTQRFCVLLDHVVKTCRADFEFSKTEVDYREKVLRNLEKYIQEEYADARLFLFGSSKNGFGFRNSDIDICMILEGRVRNDVAVAPVINTLAKLLKKHRDCANVLPIVTAKVPIVKFYLRSCKREADISLYNTLALENTRMLATYAKLDDRLTTLGYTVKVFAKVCEIGDASKGSLSSYAYILMLLHYLQQCNVIPVLQTLYPDDQPPPEKIIDGWNCWFFEDISNIKNVWNPKRKNTSSVGLLWHGFLRYYTEEFDFEHDVVCCRRTKQLSKFEKMWTKHVFAIEDPFNLDHNLGAGVTRKMAHYIQTTFMRGRELFGTPRYDIHPEIIQQYFFDVYYLTDGCEAPTDRNCRVCGKIGHIARDCPLSKSNRRAEYKKEEAERSMAREAAEKSTLSSKPFNAEPSRPRSASAPSKQNQSRNSENRAGTQPQSTPAGRKEGDGTSSTSLARSQPESQGPASPAQSRSTEETTGVPHGIQAHPQPAGQPLPSPSSISQNGERVPRDGQEESNFKTQSSILESQVGPPSDPVLGRKDVTVAAGQDLTSVSSPKEYELDTKKMPSAAQQQSLVLPANAAEVPGRTNPIIQPCPVVGISSGQQGHVPPASSRPGGGMPPPGFFAQGGVTQLPVPGSPQFIPQSPPLHASPGSWYERQPTVFSSPPEHQWGLVNPQTGQFVGSPAQHEMWLRQQHGLVMSPHSPPVRPLVPYALSPDPEQVRQQRREPESSLMPHVGSPGHGAWVRPDDPTQMLPQSPPVISRNMMWPVAPNSPPQVAGIYPGLAVVGGQSPSIPGYHPQIPPGHSPGVPATVIGSPQQPILQPHPQQPVFGAHMTGEQFIDFMRAFENTPQKSEQIHQTKLSSNDTEPKSPPHTPSKELKVAKTAEERQLLTKLSKVRSLWESDAVDSMNGSFTRTENASVGDQLDVLVVTEEGSEVLTADTPELSAGDETHATLLGESGSGMNVGKVAEEEKVDLQSTAQETTVPSEGGTKNVTSLELNGNVQDKEESPPLVEAALSEQQLQATEEKSKVNGVEQREANSKQSNAQRLTEQEGVTRPKSKRRGGRNRRRGGSRQGEGESGGWDTQGPHSPHPYRGGKNSPQRGQHYRNYDDFRDESPKVSPLPKKPKGVRSEGKFGDPRSPGRGSEGKLGDPTSLGRGSGGKLGDSRSPGRGSGGKLGDSRSPGRGSDASVTQSTSNSEDSPMSEKEKGGKSPGGKKPGRVGDTPTRNPNPSRGADRGGRKPRTRTKSTGQTSDKDDTRGRSNSAPQKR